MGIEYYTKKYIEENRVMLLGDRVYATVIFIAKNTRILIITAN